MLEDLEDQGIDPPALLNKPDCPQWLQSHLIAFQLLSRTRSNSINGALPIQLSEIKAYLELYPSDHDIESFVEIMIRTDIKFLSFLE